MIRCFWLDPNGDNLPPAGTIIVEDEVTLLKEFGGSGAVWVKGKKLCVWANDTASARRWEVKWLDSPVNELCRACPILTQEQSSNIIKAIGPALATLERPIKAVDVAQCLWPELDLLLSEPNSDHTFRWLLWLASCVFNDDQVTFARALAAQWAATAPLPLSRGYEAREPVEAWQIIKEWLRVTPSSLGWPTVPNITMPLCLVKRLEEELRLKAVQTQGCFFMDLLQLMPARDITEQAAGVAVEYFKKNPKTLSHEYIKQIQRFIKIDQLDSLFALLAPKDPGLPPKEFEGIAKWFIGGYLPFRVWRGGNGNLEHSNRVRELGRIFAEWYLTYYAKSRAGGCGAEYLSWSKTSRLSIASDHVILLTVLDGLGYRDADTLLGYILRKSNRISLDDFSVVMAPLPTVTEFAKKALFTGVHPAYAIEEKKENLGSLEKKDTDVVAALVKAQPGEIVIWSLLEPDDTYHKQKESNTMRSEVDSRLQSIAERLVRIVNETKESQKLRIVVSTDHGRLLTNATRCQPVPEGMKAHGRAAWGNVNVQIGPDGFLIIGDLAYLHPERYGVPEVCAIVLSDEGFMASDGRGGIESYPHGGLYPEEVLIPWIVLSRDRGALALSAAISGRYMAGGTGGTLCLKILNGSDVRITARKLLLRPTGHIFSLGLEIPPMGSNTINLVVPSWPSAEECQGFEGILSYSLPTEDWRDLTVVCEVEAEEMYSRKDILDDL
jgi:hypothetical protein